MLTNHPSDRKTLPAMKNTPIFRNPENIDPSTIPDGWRFTLPEEHGFDQEGRPNALVKHKLYFKMKNGFTRTHDIGSRCEKEWTAITNAPLPEKYREEQLDWHNPDKVTQAQLEPEQGWRFLTEDEVMVDRQSPSTDIQAWTGKKFAQSQRGYYGADKTMTYRVKWPLPAKYQKLSENKSEPSLDERYIAQTNQFCATVKEVELRGQWKFLRSCRLVMADNPRHGNDPSFEWDSSITFQYGKSPTAELLETGEVKFHDGVKMPLKVVRYVQP